MDYRNFIRHSKPTPRAESQRKYAEGWDRVFKARVDGKALMKQCFEVPTRKGTDETDT